MIGLLRQSVLMESFRDQSRQTTTMKVKKQIYRSKYR